MNTKESRKQSVSKLAAEFLREEDRSKLPALKNEIIRQVATCPFTGGRVNLLKMSVAAWGDDLDRYIAGQEDRRDAEL